MRAVNNHLIVEPDPKKEKSKGGIIIPEKAQDPPISGLVVLAEDKATYPFGCKVYYPNYAIRPLELEIDGEQKLFHVIASSEVLLVEDIVRPNENNGPNS